MGVGWGWGVSRIVSAEEARKLLDGAPGPLTAELDVFDPDEHEAEASVNTEGVTVLFTAGTGETFPNGTQDPADLERWRALNDSEPMRYARLFAAAPDLAATVIALSDERDRLLRDFTGMDAAGWEQEEKDHAAFLLAENRGGGVVVCPTCGRGSFVDGTADIDLSPRVCLSCEIAGLREREAAQMDMLHEEIGELLTAIGHFKRGRNTVADVAGEIADVRIMLEQLTVILDCAALVDERMDAKLTRLDDRVTAHEQAAKNPLLQTRTSEAP